MQRRGGKEGEGMLSTDSIKWSKHAPIISKRSIELKLYVCSQQKAKKESQRSSFLKSLLPSREVSLLEDLIASAIMRATVALWRARSAFCIRQWAFSLLSFAMAAACCAALAASRSLSSSISTRDEPGKRCFEFCQS